MALIGLVGSPALAIGRTNDVLTVLVRRVETSVTLVSRTEEGNGTWLP